MYYLKIYFHLFFFEKKGYDVPEVINMIENFGKNVARLRKEFGYSQKELADKLDVQKQTISNIERGMRYPTFESLEKIAKVFHATPIQLFGTDKEVAVSDVPDILDRIDEYDQKVQNIFRASNFFKEYSIEDIEYVNEQIKNMEDFFFARPQLDEDGVPVTDEKGEIIMLPSRFSRIPLDKIEHLADNLQLINGFFFARPQFDDDGEPMMNKEQEVLTAPSYFSKIPFDKIEQLVKEIEYIKENQELL